MRNLALLFGGLAVAACSGDSGETAVAKSTANVTPTLNTYINQSLEIDQLTSPPQDANLFVGADPADGSASAQVPTGGPSTFIDWNDLTNLANHRLQDLDDASGKDPSAFPQSNECVGSAQVLSKMNLTYVATANNSKYIYLAVQRSNNNGDAGYYWLFTKLPPRLNPGEAPCKAGQSRLVYDITGPNAQTGAGGDLLLGGHFHPNGSPYLQVYRATGNKTGVSAVDAVNFTSSLWQLDPAGVSAVAVNTTVTAPGIFGSAGVVGMKGSNLDIEIVAEAAVPVTVFTGSQSACGATFYGSVITRSSGAGGTSPDLKDLAGPALFNFGGVTATAALSPSCGLQFGYSASATAADGTALTGAQCSWTFSNGATSSSCSGDVAAAAGSYTGTVTITDPTTSCSDTITTASVNVYAPLSVAADLQATCLKSFAYDVTVSGGSNPGGVTYAWTFSGGTVTPASSSSKSGSVGVKDAGIPYTGSVVVTDPRTDIVCQASSSDSAVPLEPLKLALSPVAAPQTCPSMSSDAVTYQAVPSGGNGNYSFSWFGASCLGATCTIDPDDSVFCTSIQVNAALADDSGLCPPATSETETYSKSTLVTATNN